MAERYVISIEPIGSSGVVLTIAELPRLVIFGETAEDALGWAREAIAFQLRDLPDGDQAPPLELVVQGHATHGPGQGGLLSDHLLHASQAKPGPVRRNHLGHARSTPVLKTRDFPQRVAQPCSKSVVVAHRAPPACFPVAESGADQSGHTCPPSAEAGGSIRARVDREPAL